MESQARIRGKALGSLGTLEKHPHERERCIEKHMSGDILCMFFFFPQIAIALGVLTSNRGGGRRTTLADWTWHQGAIAGCSGRGAIAGCHRRVPL